VVSALTCAAGEFAIPGYDSLSELLVMQDCTKQTPKPLGCAFSGGAIATWAPTGLSEAAPALVLGKGFFQGLFGTTKKVLGDAVLAAASYAATNKVSRWMLDIYNILGDPALQVK